MYTVYIIYSLVHKKYYVGSTANIEKRLDRHNKGGSIWTRKYKPWKLVYTEIKDNKNIAHKREKEIKSWKGGNNFRHLLINVVI